MECLVSLLLLLLQLKRKYIFCPIMTENYAKRQSCLCPGLQIPQISIWSSIQVRSMETSLWIWLGSDTLRHGHGTFRGCPVVSGMRALAVNPSSPASCEVGPPLIALVWLVPCVLDQIQIWGSAEAYVSFLGPFLGPFLSNLCCVAGHIVLLGWHCHQGMALQWGVVLNLQWSLGRLCVSELLPNECRWPRFPRCT